MSKVMPNLFMKKIIFFYKKITIRARFKFLGFFKNVSWNLYVEAIIMTRGGNRVEFGLTGWIEVQVKKKKIADPNLTRQPETGQDT